MPFEYPDVDLISKNTLISAIDICISCAGDFLKVFDPPPIEYTDAQELNAWFDSSLRSRGVRFVLQTEVRQYCLNKLRSKNRLDRALMTLQGMGYIRLFKWGKHKAIDLAPLLYCDQFMVEMALGKPSGHSYNVALVSDVGKGFPFCWYGLPIQTESRIYSALTCRSPSVFYSGNNIKLLFLLFLAEIAGIF